MRLTFAKIGAVVAVLVGVVGGGFVSVTCALYFKGGSSLVSEVLTRKGQATPQLQMLEVLWFSCGAGLGVWSLLRGFFVVGVATGLLTRDEARAMMGGPHR